MLRVLQGSCKKGGANNGDAVQIVTYNAEVMVVVIVGMHLTFESVTHKDHPAAQAQENTPPQNATPPAPKHHSGQDLSTRPRQYNS